MDVVATHLTHLLKQHASRLLGVEAVADLLDGLRRPRLIAEVIPARVSLITLRAVLRLLLSEGISIRDLELILETLADHATPDSTPEGLAEILRPTLQRPS